MEPETASSDAAGYFGSQEDIFDYLGFWMKEGTPREIARALGDVARAKGITEVSLKSAGARHSLCPALSREGNPTLDVLCAVLDALGLELSVSRKAA
jgi:probable addiction module antidote protein